MKAIPTTRVVLDLNDLELAQLHHWACTAPAAANAGLIQKILATTNRPIPEPSCGEVLKQLVGKFVNLSLVFRDGRTRNFKSVQLLSVGPRGGVVYDCWPTSFDLAEVVSCTEARS